MKKYIYVMILILLLFMASSYVYMHFDELKDFWNNEDWKIIEVFETVPISNYFSIDGTDSNLIIVGNNYIHGYSSSAKENFDISISLKNAITDAEGDYCIIGEKDSSKIYMINANAKIWEFDIEGSILDVSVNKNGYAAIIYKQVGYKSLIKVIKSNGEELFTTYLASNYAIDVEISNDNKTLAIAEINAEGVNVESIIEFVNMTDFNNKNSEKVALTSDSLITDIEYNPKNKLIVQTDKNVLFIDNNEIKTYVEDFSDKTKIVSIKNSNKPVTISKVDNGLFSSNYVLKIYDYKTSGVTIDEYQLEELPSIVTAEDNNIVLLLEKEIIVLNSNGKLVKKCEVLGNIKSIVSFNNGHALALIYRDKIEFMKI